MGVSNYRKGSSHMIEIGDDTILLDHGHGGFGRLLEAGKQPSEVSHLIFTHLHFDHCADYGTLVLTRWDQAAAGVPELKVFGPPPLARMTRQLFAPDGFFDVDITARTGMKSSLEAYQARGGFLPRPRPAPLVKEIVAGDVIDGKEWRISTIEVRHAQPYMACLAVRFECADGVFVYSGDTGPIPEMVEFARDCDLLLHMCHYLSPAPPSDQQAYAPKSNTGHLELARLASEANVGMLVTTHSSVRMAEPDQQQRMLREMAALYGGRIVFGQDLLRLALPPR